ncbi:hypothetical protein JAGODDHD_04314 [Sphingomonas paucimobilis]|nr:hypothetical protein [Sphingomonas paucimobilis]
MTRSSSDHNVIVFDRLLLGANIYRQTFLR